MERKDLSRRSLMRNIGLGSAAVALGGLLKFDPISDVEAASRSASLSQNDIDILNFALNLEYLEAEFYSFATTGAGIDSRITSGVGREGLTTGGVATTFTEPLLQAAAGELTADETLHVRYLRRVLGRNAVGKPAIRLDPLGSFATQSAFLTYARAFEDTGVSAYSGAAPLIRNATVLAVAAKVLAVEAYHAGNIRLFAIQQGVSGSALDSKDQVPSANNFFPTSSSGLAISRSTREVIRIVAPFFPNGLNGRIR